MIAVDGTVSRAIDRRGAGPMIPEIQAVLAVV
jgi:hypothetical protein